MSRKIKNNNELDNLIKGFSTTPFMFIGSGLARRYYDLPDWRGLLEIFARRINNDDFAFVGYENKSKNKDYDTVNYPRIAQLIERDFNEKWFSDEKFRQLDNTYLEHVRQGVSPFKAEIAMFIHNNSNPLPEFEDEIQKLQSLSQKSISGIITTNYDCLIEKTMEGFTTYIGQEELVFSAIQGIAEIYKIHGCVTKPETIIINEEDYKDFEEKSTYLAAKLMTIFMEYPIIFMGYSLNDVNIQTILKSIANCLSYESLKKLENRLIFVQYEPRIRGVEISTHTISFDSKTISMTRISLSDFALFFSCLAKKKSGLPTRMLRMFKNEFYNYVLTNTPTATVRVAELDDDRIKDEELVISIGKPSDFGLKGLKGLDGNEWYRDIIIDDLEFNADELLEYAYPSLIRQNNILPLHKYLSRATKEFKECEEIARNNTFEGIISNTIRNNRNKINTPSRSVLGIWNDKNINLDKKCNYIAHLFENEIRVEDLEYILKDIFRNDPDILNKSSSNTKSNIRRLIRIYDYLKFAKK